jgi:hypothetical protein
MGRMAVKDLTTRIGLAWSETEAFREVLDDAYALASPSRNQFKGTRSPGETHGNQVFDSTLMTSLNRFANRIQSALFPSFQDWAEFVPGNTLRTMVGDDEKTLNEYRAQADAATAVCFASIHRSNFAQAIHEMLMDLGFGTGCMLVNEMPVGEENLFECVAVNPAEMAFDSGPYGKVWGVFRKHEVKPHLVKSMWPDFKAPDGWEEVVKESMTSNKKIKLDEACYYDEETGKWYFDIIYYGDVSKYTSNSSGGTRIVERTMDNCRWIVPRWMRMTGETRGRGPVLQALPTAKSLNKAQELLLINGSFQIHPMFTYVDDGIFNPGTFSIVPGTLNAVSTNGGSRGRSVETLDVGGDLRLTQFIFENMQMDIKKIMLDDQLPPEQGGVRSATEWTARQAELSNSIGAPFGRIFSEFIQPFMKVVLEIHVKRGIIPKQTLDGHVTSLRVTAPFAQSQNVNEVNAAAQLIELTSMLGEETVQMSLKTENFGKYFAEKMGIPYDELIRTDDEREQMQQEAMAMQQAQMQQEQQFAMEQQMAKQPQGA